MKATEQYCQSRVRGAVCCVAYYKVVINVVSGDEILKRNQLNEATEQYCQSRVRGAVCCVAYVQGSYKCCVWG